MGQIPDDAPDKYDLYPIHKALGMITLLLVMIRLPVRFKSDIPEPAPGLQKWEHHLSHLIHIALYLAMITMTWSGYLMNSTYEYVKGVDIFGLFTVPDITSQ